MGLTRGSASLSKRPKSSTIYYLSAHVNHGKTNILQQHCKYSHNHCCRTNSVCVSSFIESSPHTTRHALHQCPHLYHPRCSPHLADSMTQFGKIERRTILISDPEWHLIPYIFYPVHVWTHNWSVHGLDVMLAQKYHCITCYMWEGIVWHKHKMIP